MAFATVTRIEFNPGWFEDVAAKIAPQMHRIASDARDYIESPDGAPVGAEDDPHRGELRQASFSRVSPVNSSVELGVDLSRAKWGLYVIKGTVNMHANDYLGRAAAHALQMQRARGVRGAL